MFGQSSWGNEEKTIIHRELSAMWTWDEYYELVKQEQKLIKTISHPVIVIIDASAALNLPISSLRYFKQILENPSPFYEKYILVSKHQAYCTLYRILMQILPEAQKHFFIVQTLDEAYQLANYNIQNPQAL